MAKNQSSASTSLSIRSTANMPRNSQTAECRPMRVCVRRAARAMAGGQKRDDPDIVHAVPRAFGGKRHKIEQPDQPRHADKIAGNQQNSRHERRKAPDQSRRRRVAGQMIHLPDQRDAAAKGDGGENIENAGEHIVAVPGPPCAGEITGDDDRQDQSDAHQSWEGLPVGRHQAQKRRAEQNRAQTRPAPRQGRNGRDGCQAQRSACPQWRGRSDLRSPSARCPY